MQDKLTTILLVDDAALDLEILQKFLNGEPYALELAHNGTEALQKLEANPDKFHAVLLDQVMPDLSGLDVIKKIKSQSALKYIPIIFQTANATKNDILLGLQAGAHYYLTKPFTIDELKIVVRAAVREYTQIINLTMRLKKETASLKLMDYGEFTLKSLQEADALASLLANATPSPESTVLGLSELLINAVEHGNLGINYDDKSQLWKTGTWLDEVERRLLLPENKDKIVRVKFTKNSVQIKIKITDEGNGFEWQKFLGFDPARAYDTHGRGIATANQFSFNDVIYYDKGNIVEAIIKL